MRQYFTLDLWPRRELRGFQAVARLQVQPVLRRGIEIPRQPQCGVRRDASLFANNIVDAIVHGGLPNNNRGRTTFVFKTFKNNGGLSPNTPAAAQSLRYSSAGLGNAPSPN